MNTIQKLWATVRATLGTLKAFAKRALSQLYTGKAFRRAQTMPRTVASFVLFAASIIALTAWTAHIVIDTYLYTPVIALGAICFKLGEKVHGPYLIPAKEPA